MVLGEDGSNQAGDWILLSLPVNPRSLSGDGPDKIYLLEGGRNHRRGHPKSAERDEDERGNRSKQGGCAFVQPPPMSYRCRQSQTARDRVRIAPVFVGSVFDSFGPKSSPNSRVLFILHQPLIKCIIYLQIT